jgi:hypothetical protein
MRFNIRSLNAGILSIIFLLVYSGGQFYAQNRLQTAPRLDHHLNYHPEKKYNPYVTSQFPETLYVYAMRVQFKPDNNPNTTGNGTFDLSNNYPDSVDAPPHDSTYFINHLEFLKNYYFKASKGKLIIKYSLIGGTRFLSQEMKEYSPGRTEGLDKMGRLFFESWASADSVIDFTGIDASKSAFIIFHAGVGRDVDLISSGIFQGQQDIPSLFLGLNSLKSIYGDTTKGYYTKEGVIIPGSCILPEQEYRIIESSISPFFLELGLNGIIVASIGSSLGLPDLFDTQTGNTAIGRFGLMDGQSLFSFLGVFPPEPSAWEKQYLGWIDPIEVYSNGTYTSKAASIDYSGSSSVYKVFISAKEYFLVENRNRDALKNGQKIYFVKNGILDSMTFTKDEDGFQNGDIWKLKGNIVDVDELDWSLPGLKNDTVSYQGGLLIWHIDENVIDANITSNTINNNIEHRGVNLEEAKGAQEIGYEISTPLGVFIGDGTFVDYWYNGNHFVPSTIYKNEFSPFSIPNSKSYSNFNSRVCLSGFSVIDSSMTFNFELCGSIANMSGFPRFVGIDTSANAQPIGFDYNGNGLDEIFVNVKDSLYGFRDNGNPIRVDMPNGFLKDSAAGSIVGYAVVSSVKYVIGTYGNKLSLLNFTIDSLTSAPSVITINSAFGLSTPVLVITDRLGAFDSSIYAGTNNGRIAKFKTNLSGTVLYDSVSNSSIRELAYSISGTLPYGYTFIDESFKFLASSGITIFKSIEPNSTPVRITNNNRIMIGSDIIPDHLGITDIYSSPTIAYFDKDTVQDILFSADNKLFAVNRYGVVLNHFPFSVNGVNKISGGVAVADIDGDGVYEAIFGTGDGRVYAYNSQGKILDGFPVLAGKEIKSTPAIVNTGGKFGIVVYSTDGYLYGWKTAWDYDSTKVLWKNFLNDKYHSNEGEYVSNAPVTGPCLPSDKVYNWPNPVYSGSTNIRYFLNGTANSVKIKIMDLSGELVTTLTGTANTGFDNEAVWDVSNVQSGIYIAVLELEGGDCSETPSIKIAVVK